MQANAAGIGIRQICCLFVLCKVLITCLTFEKDHIFENKMFVSQRNHNHYDFFKWSAFYPKQDAICKHHKTTNKYVDISAYQFQIDSPFRF